MIQRIKRPTRLTTNLLWKPILPNSARNLFAVLMLALLGSCSDDDDSDDASIESTKTFFQIVNGIPTHLASW